MHILVCPANDAKLAKEKQLAADKARLEMEKIAARVVRLEKSAQIAVQKQLKEEKLVIANNLLTPEQLAANVAKKEQNTLKRQENAKMKRDDKAAARAMQLL